MYAVIKTGGKQYKVSAGDKIKVEQLSADIDADIQIDQVLAVGSGDQISVGAPLVGGATVSVTVLSHGRREKVRIFKMRRRKHYRKQQGHRQNYTELFVTGISSPLGEVKADAEALAKARASRRAAADDLVKIEGIGPKINGLLVKAGITTFAQLAATPVEKLKEILAGGGPRFAAHDPGTWPEQAALAAKGDWAAFEKLTDELKGGRRV
jgi:large subunit ribosomal protein L21